MLYLDDGGTSNNLIIPLFNSLSLQGWVCLTFRTVEDIATGLEFKLITGFSLPSKVPEVDSVQYKDLKKKQEKVLRHSTTSFSS